MQTRSSLVLSIGCLAALATAGCGTTGTAGGEEKGDKDEAEDDEVEELGLKVGVAELELELAKLGGVQELASAERELAKAKVDLEKARIEVDAFSSIGRARELDEARLGLDQSRGRAEDAAAELAELEAMYSAEEFASKTKELVLQRGRRDLEHAKRALDLSERKLKELEGFDLKGKERQLEQARLAGEKGVFEGEQTLEKLRLEKMIAVRKAEQELAEIQKKFEKAKAKKLKQQQP